MCSATRCRWASIEQVPGGGQLGKDDQVGGQLAGPGDRRFQRFATGTVVRGVEA